MTEIYMADTSSLGESGATVFDFSIRVNSNPNKSWVLSEDVKEEEYSMNEIKS